MSFWTAKFFTSVADAQVCLGVHRRWYNGERPHSSLNYAPPAAYAQDWQQKQVDNKPPC